MIHGLAAASSDGCDRWHASCSSTARTGTQWINETTKRAETDMSNNEIRRRDVLAGLGAWPRRSCPATVTPVAYAAEPTIKGDGGKFRWLANAAGTSAFRPM